MKRNDVCVTVGCLTAGMVLTMGLAMIPVRAAAAEGVGVLVFHDPLEGLDGGPEGRVMPAVVEFSPGKVGNGAHFVAGSRGIGYPVALLPFDEGTIEFRVSADEAPATFEHKRVLFQYSPDGSKKNFFALFHGGEKDWGKELILLVCDGQEKRFSITRPLTEWQANEWHHVAVTWKLNAEQGSSIALYVDRELVRQADGLTIMQDRDAIEESKGNREFGYLWFGIPGPGLGLKIDELKVYNVRREYSAAGGN